MFSTYIHVPTSSVVITIFHHIHLSIFFVPSKEIKKKDIRFSRFRHCKRRGNEWNVDENYMLSRILRRKQEKAKKIALFSHFPEMKYNITDMPS